MAIQVERSDADRECYVELRGRVSNLRTVVLDVASRATDAGLMRRFEGLAQGLSHLIEELTAAIAGGPSPVDNLLAGELRAAVQAASALLEPQDRSALTVLVEAVGDTVSRILTPADEVPPADEPRTRSFTRAKPTAAPTFPTAARRGPTAAPTMTTARMAPPPPPPVKRARKATKVTARAKPPQARRGPEQRRVVLDLYDVTQRGERQKVADRLESKHRYELELFIAAHREGTVAATEAFRSETLPEGDVVLSVHFVPLERSKSGKSQPAQHKRLTLPATADSRACKFEFAVPASVTIYRARIILSYRNRILQTLILSAPVGKAKGTFRLEPENVLEPAMQNAKRRAGFDAALIVNHSPRGKAGVTTVRGADAVFAEPAGLDAMATDLRKLILKNAALRASKKFESKEVQELIYGLSRKGKGLWDELPDAAHDLLGASTRRIQIVDARPGAYFPAEFVYRGRSPNQGAQLCPNAAKALLCPATGAKAGAKSHDACKNRDDPKFTCPMRMWGFGLVIERQPQMGVPQPGFVLRDIEKTKAGKKVEVLDRVVVAMSSKVARADKKAPANLVAALQKSAKKVSLARDWKELEKTIAKESPTLLVLLPHSDVDSEDATIPTLELGGETLSRDRLEPEYVRGPKCAHPVVLLLGCETQMSEIPFLNFIKKFKDCGASMVMGTITEVDALRTAAFVARFVSAFAASTKGISTFGELLLETRRNLLAAGDGFAMSLLAYGDTDQ